MVSISGIKYLYSISGEGSKVQVHKIYNLGCRV
jgi:hypothetical protein